CVRSDPGIEAEYDYW
nr:immunoglobulin heavy chain junction region [Macaca mulatta]MOX92672.1 immunoglobulin heavy chain junction region [Macaca mulatta]